ncbi:MAG TPA: NnrS family protein, partial [Casimicrobiaceae bacterium]
MNDPVRVNAVSGEFALWSLGFRPFYLLASSFAALSILLWICQYTGHLPTAYLRPPAWHGHEMLYGYTVAVLAGFLLTAVRNWTGRATPAGPMLMALAVLWVAGRVLVLTPFPFAAAVVNAAFPVAIAIAIGIPLVQSNNRRNYFFIALLLLLGAAVLALHLSPLGVLPWPERASLQAGLDVVLFVLAVMGGRVIPMFTNNGVPGANATRHPWVEKIALGSVLALLGADLLPLPAAWVACLAFAAA